MAPYMNHFKFLKTIPFLYVLVTVTCTDSSLSHDEECSALFQFKQSITHQDDAACAAYGSQVFRSWNNSFDCCSWEGVACSNDQEGHVIDLDLSESSLCGHINSNSTLFSLIHLQRFNLSGNDFGESQIPSEIARLKQLRILDLSYCGFSGQIPNEISQLMHLSSLDLSWNSLKLNNPSLKDLVKNLTGLEELHLSGVDISSSVPHFLANFSSLRSIKLIECSLWNEFPAAILELPKLQVLNLAYNTDLNGSLPEFRNNSLLEVLVLHLTGFFGIVPESISHLEHLTTLSFSMCSFSGPIPGSLSNLTQLTYLALGNYKFPGLLVPSLGSLSKLEILELDGNKFEKGRLPIWLGKLTNLRELYLCDMNINGEIPPFLANLTKLSKVVLSYNYLIGRIPSWLSNNTQLTYLDLLKNQLQGPIPNTFSNFKSLEYLDLGTNNFSGRVELDMFLELNKLQTLSLGYNRISLVVTNNYTNTTLPELNKLELPSCNLKKFPAFLRYQNKLTYLILDRNKIDGLVPVWVWNNSRETLEYFDLSYNSITGFDQHPHFIPWRNLEGFAIAYNQLQGQLPIPPQNIVFYYVSHNNLTGEISQLICEMKYLKLLDLSFNNMSGTLPSCLGSLSNLIALKMRGNNFHGKMMNDFMPGSLLKEIDLSENRFFGQLPRSLTNCASLEVLSLADNSFHDVFPSWLGTLAKLQVLVLRSNNFYGPIQGSTTISSQFPKLRIIDLSNNSFSGQLHQNYFQTWNAMRSDNLGISSIMKSDISSDIISSNLTYTVTLVHKGVRMDYQHILTIDMAIDLSCNHFEGEIPLSLQDLQGLQSLNLSNNHFSGRVLESLGQLKNLEALDLSRNELSGEIPQQLVQLGFLEIFNVSNNYLEGRIPKGKQFDTFDNNSYMGNPRLCGQPLSKECQDSKVSRLPPTSNVSESLFPSERIDWIIVFCGVGSGLAVGIVIGNFVHTRYSDWFTKRKDRWVRPLRNTRKN